MTLAGSPRFLLAVLLSGITLFLIGAAIGRPLVAAGLMAVVLTAIAVGVWRSAGTLALESLYERYAAAHGYSPSRHALIVASTPLLGAGRRRSFTHYIEGQLPGVDGAEVALAHYVVESEEGKSDHRNRPIAVVRRHEFTVATTEISRPALTFPKLLLFRPARGGFNWISSEDLVPATLRNTDLAARSQLLVAPGQDRERLRGLISTGLQSYLAASSLDPGFEYCEGVLVVYVAGRLSSDEHLDSLVALTARIATCLLEAGEPLGVAGIGDSKGPPTGVAAFPPPPAATKPRAGFALRAVSLPKRRVGRAASIPPPRN